MKRRGLTIALVAVVILFGSFGAIFATQLRCVFVRHSELRAAGGNLYLDPAFSSDRSADIVSMVAAAKQRDASFAGPLRSDPVIIVAEDPGILSRFAGSPEPTAVTHLFFGGEYVVIGPDGTNVDVIAHELMHAELCERVGWVNRELSMPIWFDEGLAMQVDHRPEYSEEQWSAGTRGGVDAPPLDSLADRALFASERWWQSYATAKHEVARWLALVGRRGLDELVERAAAGEDVAAVYREIERRR